MKVESNQTSKELQTFIKGDKKAITHQVVNPNGSVFFATECFENQTYCGLKTWFTEEQAIECVNDWIKS